MNTVRNSLARTCLWFAEWLSPKRFATPRSEPDRVVIEFLGGPLDGHWETVERVSLEQLRAWIEVPISKTLFDVLGGSIPSNDRRMTSIAIYDLIPSDLSWLFRFHCQTSALCGCDGAKA